MKKTLLFSLGILTATIGFSQTNFATTNGGSSGAANGNYDLYLRTINIDEKETSFGLTKAEFNAIKNDAYVNSTCIAGNIYQDENLLKSGILMRYNAYADEIEIAEDLGKKSKYGALTKDESIFVKIANDIYVFVPYNGSNEKGGYFNVLAEGKTYNLYKKTISYFREPQKAKTSYGSNTSAAFDKTTKYYLVKKGEFFELPTGKARLLKVMDSKKDEVVKFIKENKLEVDNESDFIKVFTYFDSLL